MSLLVNAYCTVLQAPALDFPHELNASRDRNDPALGEHLEGFKGYVMKDDRPMNPTRYAVLRHLGRVRHHYSLEVAHEHLNALGAWAQSANALLFLPTGHVTDPFGRTLVDASDGSASDTAEMPYPADAVARKGHHDSWMESQQIPFATTLPPTLGAAEVLPRPAHEVALRMMALLLVAIRAESVNSGEPIPANEMQQRFPAVFDALTPNEHAFITNPAPGEQAVVDHAWKYEAADTLRWALGRSEQLPFASEICDVPATAGDLMQNGPEAILAEATLRPIPELLDQADLHLRLHWSVRQAGIDGSEPPRSLQNSVLQERRHALNWLIRLEDEQWDNVTTPT